MSFILVDKSDDRRDVKVNGWNWRPTVAILAEAGILPAGERAEMCLCNGCGGYFTEEEARKAAGFVGDLLARMKPGERVMSDGRINDRPKDYSLPVTEWDEQEVWNRYSASYEWLVTFEEFLGACKGLDVY